MKKISAVALNLLLFEELQVIVHSVGAGTREVVKESPQNHKWRGSEQDYCLGCGRRGAGGKDLRL